MLWLPKSNNSFLNILSKNEIFSMFLELSALGSTKDLLIFKLLILLISGNFPFYFILFKFSDNFLFIYLLKSNSFDLLIVDVKNWFFIERFFNLNNFKLLFIYIDLKRKESEEFNFVDNKELFFNDLSLLLEIWVLEVFLILFW